MKIKKFNESLSLEQSVYEKIEDVFIELEDLKCKVRIGILKDNYHGYNYTQGEFISAVGIEIEFNKNCKYTIGVGSPYSDRSIDASYEIEKYLIAQEKSLEVYRQIQNSLNKLKSLKLQISGIFQNEKNGIKTVSIYIAYNDEFKNLS